MPNHCTSGGGVCTSGGGIGHAQADLSMEEMTMRPVTPATATRSAAPSSTWAPGGRILRLFGLFGLFGRATTPARKCSGIDRVACRPTRRLSADPTGIPAGPVDNRRVGPHVTRSPGDGHADTAVARPPANPVLGPPPRPSPPLRPTTDTRTRNPIRLGRRAVRRIQSHGPERRCATRGRAAEPGSVRQAVDRAGGHAVDVGLPDEVRRDLLAQ